MNADDVGFAFLFLVIVGLVIALGVVVGMIAAGRIDRIMSPTPRRTPDDAAPASAPDAPTPPPTKEDQP